MLSSTLLVLLPLLAASPTLALPSPFAYPAAPSQDILDHPHLAAARAVHQARRDAVVARQHANAGKRMVRKPKDQQKHKKKRACAVQTPVAASTSTEAIETASSSSAAAAAESSSATASMDVTSAPASSTSTSVPASSTGYPEESSAASSSASTETETDTTPSATSSSAAPAQSTSTGLTGMLARLFPVSVSSKWTTSPESSDALSFTGALKPLSFGKLPSEASAPDGADALVANYPAGTVGYSSSTGHGFSFYSPGDKDGVDVSTASEVVMSYSVYFPDGFQFVKGGKLPGLYGGTSLAVAKSCSGGRQDDREDCFSARLMWRTDGAGEFYNYLPTQDQGSGYCTTAPYSICDADYGDSIGRGSFSFATGQWTTVAQRLKLNDVGQKNGEQELFVNGESVLSLSGLTFAVKEGTHIYGIFAQTFFGGHTDDWASPQDQSAYFKDWSLAVVA